MTKMIILLRRKQSFALFVLMVLVDRAFVQQTVVVQALSSSASAAPSRRILCYGDSLTAGTTSGTPQLYPYASQLEMALNEHPSRTNVVVRHRGLPGWTAKTMLEVLDGEQGLQSAIRRVQNPPLSLIVLLAGSNDLGYNYGAEAITENIIALHQVAWDNNIPTLAIGIPSSGYQSQVTSARDLATQINQNLKDVCDQSDRSSFVTFPFQFEKGGENWASDTLHFSPMGYQALAKALVPHVEHVLNDLEENLN